MKAALIRLTAYGAAACVGACFAAVGILATANRLVRTYPTTT